MRALLLAGAMGLAAMTALAQMPGGTDIQMLARDSSPGARASLGTFSKLVTEQNAQRMGFDAPADVGRAELGVPLVDFMIGLDALRAYREGQNAMELLSATGEVVYPVTIGGATRSSVVLSKQDDQWVAVSFGEPLLAKSLEAARNAVASARRVAEGDMFRVRIPALNLVFVAYTTEARLFLAPVIDSPEYRLKAGVSAPAEQVLLRLQPDAKRHDGLPR